MTHSIAVDASKKWKKIGKIGKAHGLKGAFYLGGRSNLWTGDTSAISVGPIPESGIHTTLSKRQVSKNRLILSLECFSDRSKLEAFQGQDLWSLSPEQSESIDYDKLLGFEVIAGCKTSLGLVRDFYNYGASDTMEIESKEGASLELPFNDAYIAKLDHSSDQIVLTMNADAFTELWQR